MEGKERKAEREFWFRKRGRVKKKMMETEGIKLKETEVNRIVKLSERVKENPKREENKGGIGYKKEYMKRRQIRKR